MFALIQLYTWGLASNGQLGQHVQPKEDKPWPLPAQLRNPSLRVVSLACGTFHTLVISEMGTVWSSGMNSSGQLGNGTFDDNMQFGRVEHLG